MKLSARVRNVSRAISTGVAGATRFLLAPISFREILLFGGCGLIWLGLSSVYPPAAIVVPGVIIAAVAIFGVR
jgi:hypothetical protein